MTPEQRIQQLEHELAALKAELRDRSGPLEATPGDVAIESRATSRRTLLRLGAAGAGAAVAGTALALSQASPVAANDPDDITMGENKATDGHTQANYVGATDGTAFAFQSGTTWATTQSDNPYPAALGAWASPNGHDAITNGLLAVTAHGGAGAVAVGAGAGSVGLLAIGDRAALQLEPSTASPDADTTAHELGEIVMDAYGSLWVCTAGGTPGTWRNVTQSSFTPIAPYRAYDSRWNPAPDGLTTGLLTSGSRVVSLSDSRAFTDGSVLAADLLPANATGVAFNLTIAEYSGAGHLAMTEGDADSYNTSTINFSPGNIGPIANGSSIKLDAEQQVKVFIDGVTPSTHFILDIVGYYT